MTHSQRTLARQLPTLPPDSPVTVAGWIHRRRQLSGVSFVVLRDRSGLAQIVVKDEATVAQVATLTEETVVEVTGTLVTNPAAPGGVEITEARITPLTETADTPPVELWRPTLTAGLPAILDNASVALRHPRLRASWQLAAASLRGMRERLADMEFTEIFTPKIVGTATESGANVFAIDYFGRPAYLAQSPQFYKQMMVGVHERVFEVGPVFRAEPHDTVRHLAEYTSIDVELGFIRDHRDVLAVLREVLAAMVDGIGRYAGPAASRLDLTVPVVPEQIPVIHFTRALELVGADPNEPDLEPAHERQLCEWAKTEHDSDFLAVEGYPMTKRPFYTHAQPSDPRWSNSFDLLFRGLELTTGGQRLHRSSDYDEALRRTGQDPTSYAGYLETFAHGMPPHGGFAIGLERWVARLVEAANIREVTPFPRDLHRLEP